MPSCKNFAIVVTRPSDQLQTTAMLVETLAAPHSRRQVPPPQHPIGEAYRDTSQMSSAIRESELTPRVPPHANPRFRVWR
jgi:hypothetical protein